MNHKRWLVVVGALLVQPCLGAIYAWSVFVPALKASRAELVVMLSPQVLGIDPQQHADIVAEYKRLQRQLAEARGSEIEAAKAQRDEFFKDGPPAHVEVADAVWARHHYGFNGKQAQAIFSTELLVYALAMIFAGRWQDRAGPRIVALTGGLVVAAGYALAGIAGPSFMAVLLSIGVISGAGIGLGYVCPIAACVKWFPDLRGPITGLAVAGFGGGAFFFVRLAGSWGGLLTSEGIPGTFLIFACIFAVVASCGALLLRNPPPGWKPAGWEPATGASAARAAAADFGQQQTLRTRAFWMLWLAFICASGCGLMVIGSLKDFGLREGGLSSGEADGAIVLLSIFNALGRIVWGSVAQRIGARQTLVLISLLQAGMVLMLIELGTEAWTFNTAACWIGFHFGGNLALFPLLTAEYFGNRHLGANYGLVFTGYGVGGVLGPMLAGGVWDHLHSYRWAFVPAAGGCLIAMTLALIVRPPQIKEPAAA